jgi:hypothetical protein
MSGDINMGGCSITNIGNTSLCFVNGNKIVASKFDASGNVNADCLGGSLPSAFAAAVHTHDDRYYTETEMQTSGQALLHWDNVCSKPATFTPSSHSHAWSDVNTTGSLLDDIGDVNTPATIGTGCLLCYDGSAWVPGHVADPNQVQFTAGESITTGKLVAMYNDGTAMLASDTWSDGKYSVLGLYTGAGAGLGDCISVVTGGKASVTHIFNAGTMLYLSAGGVLSSSPSTGMGCAEVYAGIALCANEIFVRVGVPLLH